ncbi:hypothetical protein BDA96_05G238600 [Sorghum bicolor]|uniref:Uncharacterized protein n=2 Tax=Sorghum bicolor TaxID=4558 RepID=A0A921UGV2_SORBI|nr:hypothetical protein BDA96_05G238600 [Sorghum bicolor]OQU84062.1 hypothetical protein SORBI_3005G222650 [Sorghum bicolor]
MRLDSPAAIFFIPSTLWPFCSTSRPPLFGQTKEEKRRRGPRVSPPPLVPSMVAILPPTKKRVGSLSYLGPPINLHVSCGP